MSIMRPKIYELFPNMLLSSLRFFWLLCTEYKQVQFHSLAQKERNQTIFLTNNTSSSRLLHDNCQPKITDFNFSMIAIHEDVITFQISMKNRRFVIVKILQTSKNLPCPAFYCLHVNMLMLLTISTSLKQKTTYKSFLFKESKNLIEWPENLLP